MQSQDVLRHFSVNFPRHLGTFRDEFLRRLATEPLSVAGRPATFRLLTAGRRATNFATVPRDLGTSWGFSLFLSRDVPFCTSLDVPRHFLSGVLRRLAIFIQGYRVMSCDSVLSLSPSFPLLSLFLPSRSLPLPPLSMEQEGRKTYWNNSSGKARFTSSCSLVSSLSSSGMFFAAAVALTVRVVMPPLHVSVCKRVIKSVVNTNLPSSACPFPSVVLAPDQCTATLLCRCRTRIAIWSCRRCKPQTPACARAMKYRLHGTKLQNRNTWLISTIHGFGRLCCRNMTSVTNFSRFLLTIFKDANPSFSI